MNDEEKEKLLLLFEEAEFLIESGCWGAVWGVDCDCIDRSDRRADYEHLPHCRVYKWKAGMTELLK